MTDLDKRTFVAIGLIAAIASIVIAINFFETPTLQVPGQPVTFEVADLVGTPTPDPGKAFMDELEEMHDALESGQATISVDGPTGELIIRTPEPTPDHGSIDAYLERTGQSAEEAGIRTLPDGSRAWPDGWPEGVEHNFQMNQRGTLPKNLEKEPPGPIIGLVQHHWEYGPTGEVDAEGRPIVAMDMVCIEHKWPGRQDRQDGAAWLSITPDYYGETRMRVLTGHPEYHPEGSRVVFTPGLGYNFDTFNAVEVGVPNIDEAEKFYFSKPYIVEYTIMGVVYNGRVYGRKRDETDTLMRIRVANPNWAGYDPNGYYKGVATSWRQAIEELEYKYNSIPLENYPISECP